MNLMKVKQFGKLSKLHMINKFPSLFNNNLYKYSLFSIGLKTARLKKPTIKRINNKTNTTKINKLTKSTKVTDLSFSNNKTEQTEEENKYTSQIERLIHKDDIYDFFFENYDKLNQDHITAIFKKIKEFHLYETDRKTIAKIINILQGDESKINSSSLLSELIQVVLNFITHQDKTSSILLDTNSLITKKIAYFTPDNIKYVFQFYSCFYYKKTNMNIELWDKFLKEIIVDGKYFDTKQIKFFDLVEIINFCFKEKQSTNSLNNENFLQILELLNETWFNYTHDLDENSLVEDLLEDDITLPLIEILYSNCITMTEKMKKKVKENEKSLFKILLVIIDICKECHRTINLDLEEIMDKSTQWKDDNKFMNYSDDEDNYSNSMPKI